MEALRNVKFNGKIYGKKGGYSIYVNNNKVEVSDEQVEEYAKYESEYKALKANFPKALNAAEVENIAIGLGIKKKFHDCSLEQIKAHLEVFKIDPVIEHTKNGIVGKIVKVTYNGEFVIAYASFSNGREVYMNQSNLESILTQLKGN